MTDWRDMNHAHLEPDALAARRAAPTAPATGATTSFTWPLSKDLRAEVRFTGRGVTAQDLDLLAKYLELAKTAVERGE